MPCPWTSNHAFSYRAPKSSIASLNRTLSLSRITLWELSGQAISIGVMVSGALIHRSVWAKGIVNAAVNPVAALVNSTVGEVMDSPAQQIVEALLTEGIEIARAEGIDLGEKGRTCSEAIELVDVPSPAIHQKPVAVGVGAGVRYFRASLDDERDKLFRGKFIYEYWGPVLYGTVNF